jgi:hypothetical protein
MAITTEMLTSVLELYTAYFNRVADKDGVDYWLNEMDSNGWTIDQVAQSFADQSEYTDIYAGMTNAQVVSTVYGNVLDRAADSDGAAYWESELANGNIAVNQLVQAVVAAAKEDVNGLGDNETLSAKVQESFSAYYTGAVTTESGDTLLTTGQDTLVGGAADDNFTAYIFDNQNTAQSGDSVDGGEGTDTLFADIGNSQNFAITLDTTSVEKFIVRAQADATDSNENNMADNVQIDAERMDGTNWYESNNSRSDVVIEDVRIEDSQITKDITIAMVNTDPGDVDMAVYFDQCSLRADSASTTTSSSIDLKYIFMGDNKNDSSIIDNFINQGVSISVDGSDYTINISGSITNYDELTAAINAGIAADAFLSTTDLVATKAEEYTETLIEGGVSQSGTGYNVVLSSEVHELVANTWVVKPGETSVNEDVIQSAQDSALSTTVGDLVTATIVLDCVGRGSMGGDLVVGGLSTGDSSDSMGVERFEITVEGSSELQTINSTNNTLREVEIVNGTESGNLTVTGDIALENDVVGDAGQDNAYGFSDVRIIDAAEMTGSLTATVELTAASVEKFLDTTDIAENTSADNSYNNNTKTTLGDEQKAFTYDLGTNSDSFTIDIDGSNLEQSGTTNREDFVMVINGNAGNDTITTNIINADSETSDAAHWYQNSKFEANLTINAGEGDDTINTIGSGDFVINGGAGNDTIYTDNTGEKATWIFNDADIDGDADVNIDNILSDTSSNTYAVSNATLTVTYYGSNVSNTAGEGYEVQVSVADNATDLQVNQAIKNAINNDAVLSKLLFAQDSQGNSIVVDALTDGVHVDGDLTVSMSTTSIDAAVISEVARFNASVKSDFELAVKDGADMTGSDSVQVSDNTIIAAAGVPASIVILADAIYDNVNEVILVSIATDTVFVEAVVVTPAISIVSSTSNSTVVPVATVKSLTAVAADLIVIVLSQFEASTVAPAVRSALSVPSVLLFVIVSPVNSSATDNTTLSLPVTVRVSTSVVPVKVTVASAVVAKFTLPIDEESKVVSVPTVTFAIFAAITAADVLSPSIETSVALFATNVAFVIVLSSDVTVVAAPAFTVAVVTSSTSKSPAITEPISRLLAPRAVTVVPAVNTDLLVSMLISAPDIFVASKAAAVNASQDTLIVSTLVIVEAPFVAVKFTVRTSLSVVL